MKFALVAAVSLAIFATVLATPGDDGWGSNRGNPDYPRNIGYSREQNYQYDKNLQESYKRNDKETYRQQYNPRNCGQPNCQQPCCNQPQNGGGLPGFGAIGL